MRDARERALYFGGKAAGRDRGSVPAARRAGWCGVSEAWPLQLPRPFGSSPPPPPRRGRSCSACACASAKSSRGCLPAAEGSSHRELHDRVDNVALVDLERLDGLGARDAGLAHHELNVLRLHPRLVHLAVLAANLLDDGLRHLRHLRLVCHHRLLELLRGRLLRLRGEVLDLSLAEDDVGVRGRRLEDVRFCDDEEDVFALLDGDAHDAGHGLHAELLHGLARLLLAARLLRARGSIAVAALGGLELRHVLVRVLLIRVLDLGILDLLDDGHPAARVRL
mmetsp:Transcript_4765/g.14583  ORF Transcript_4765/g.14583 Transcript_4765/m.14583 type:complete len:280 (+) Transcript_4765:71-910(+)